MLLSTGEAARVLAGVGVARTQSQVLLSAGLAGRAVESAGAVPYDRGAVDALANRRLVGPDDLAAACPHGLFIARLGRSRPVDVTSGWEALAADLCLQPPMPPLTRALLSARMAAYGPLPWVATLCGHVILGADAIGVHATDSGAGRKPAAAFTLNRPGPWFDELAERVLPTGRGGRPWVVRTPR